MRFRGSCHPPGELDTTYDGTLLRRDEMAEKLKSLKDTPVLLDHDNSALPIGKIVRAWIDESGRLQIEGEINRDSVRHCQVINDIKNGNLPSLSLGIKHTAGINTKSGELRIIDKNIMEVSLTGSPELPDTNISYVESDPNEFNIKRSLIGHKLINIKLKQRLYNNSPSKNYETKLFDPWSSKMADSSTPAPPPPESEEKETTPQPPVEETNEKLKELQDQLEQERKKRQELETQNSAYEKLEKNPEEIEKFFKERDAKKRKKMEEAIAAHLDFAASQYDEDGKEKDNAFLNAFKKVIDSGQPIDGLKPVVDFIAVAHSASEKRQKKADEQYHSLKQLYEQEKERTKQALENFEQNKREEQYRSTISSTPSSSSTTTTTTTTSSGQLVSPSSGENIFSAFNSRWEPDLSTVPVRLTNMKKNMGLQSSTDQVHRDLFAAFSRQGQKSRTGMDNIDYRGIAGFQYAPQGTQIGDSSVQELRSAHARKPIGSM